MYNPKNLVMEEIVTKEDLRQFGLLLFDKIRVLIR